ncbi:DUF724 domain-containing protein 2 isoform X2 [Raphanus sativus]|nr:DUF724 domain-containing protein 2 isoform X2 [Raphanus sativus]
MKRGDEIEVYSDEEGLKGSWFRAILEDPLPKYGTKKLNVSLLANDGGSTTTPKTTYRRFLRPITPESLFAAAAEFEEGCVVEASRGGGWWTGVVVKKINHEDDVVWVYFDSPPVLFQFQTGQVRQHFDWVKQEWVKPKNKVLSNKKSRFSCGTMVEVRVKGTDVWVPSVIVKEMGNRKSFVVKSLKNLSWSDDGGEAPKPNITVDSSSIRLTPPTVSVERFGLMESVEVFIDPGWRSGTVTSILCENRYTVCLKGENGSLVFKHDALRPSEETIAKLVLQNTSEVNGEKEKEVPDEHSREDDSRKRKRGEVEHNPDLSETETATETESVSSLTESGTEEFTVQPESNEEVNNDETMRIVVLPFAKESSLWLELETKLVFQRAPQQTPHFSPLVGKPEVSREGRALGMMLTFSKLVESFNDLEPDVPMSQLDSFRESFAELRKQGFDVSAPLARINKLLGIKSKQLKEMVKRNGLEGEMMALKHKIVELERQQVALREESETAYRNLSQMESRARDPGVVLDNLESEFRATSSAPW